MRLTSFATLVIATLLAIGSTYWLHAGEKRKPYPKATPPPPPSPVYTPSTERAQTEQEIARDALNHDELLAFEIESSLAARDAQRRETAFTFLLPVLLQNAPERLVAMVAHQPAGERRDILRSEVARQWITRDRDAAIRWMQSFENETEKHASVRVALDTLAVVDPEQAIYVADQFRIGR